MSKKEMPLAALNDFLPEGSFEAVSGFLHHYNVQLTITRARKSVLGDYRNAVAGTGHRISVNGNLNKYAFLITLLHELAHLLTFEKFGHRVAAHGREWKNEFSRLLRQFLSTGIFPDDVRAAVMNNLHRPSASSCADTLLTKVLHRYDARQEGVYLIEELPDGALFMIPGGRIFRKGQVIRKRHKCAEVPGGQVWLFSPVYEVRLLEHPKS